MSFTFSWNNEKEKKNIKKHNISFSQAKKAFNDPNCYLIENAYQTYGEFRSVMISLVKGLGILVVVYTQKKEHIHLISARMAVKKEIKFYQEDLGF